MVIEVKIGKGIIISLLREFFSRYDIVVFQCVKIIDDVRQKVVEFVYQQFGKFYNYNYIGKLEVYDDKYYCFQFVWVVYFVVSNYQINFDENDGGWSWKYFYLVVL